MNNTVNQTAINIISTNANAQYDDAIKRILSDPQILARILQKAVQEYSSMSVESIIPCIDTPHVSTIPVTPGLSNTMIVGENTESKIPGEGVSYYDIRFTASVPESQGKTSVNLTIDVEAQKSPYPGYDLTTRGVYYCGRMLSDQNGRVFSGRNYDNIQKVYSIWLIMNCPQKTANTISRYRLVHEALHGDFRDDSRCDLIEVAMIRLPKEGHEAEAKNSPSLLHSMLSEVLSHKSVKEKCETLNSKFGIQVTAEMKEDMNSMCNLSDIILDQGRKEGENRKLCELVQKKLISIEDAAANIGVDAETFREMAAQYGFHFD